MKETAQIKHLSIGLPTSAGMMLAVENVDFNLKPGQTTALVGESGCGKSITAHSLMRLLPENMLYGRDSEILFEGEDILNLPEFMVRSLRGRKLAMIFQEPMTALNPVLTIGQQLKEVFFQHHSLNNQLIHNEMVELLEKVEIAEPLLKLKQYPHQLSGGQKQRVMIAMAIASRPDILIADEPTTALDVTTQAQILDLLKKLQNEYQMSLLLITHDLGVVKKMADEIYVLYAGEIVEHASKVDFFNQPLHPYVQQLMLSIPSFAKRDSLLPAIKGAVPALDSLPQACRFHPRCAHVFEPCDVVKPQLQEVLGRTVRCHLYPDVNRPPPLMSPDKPLRHLEVKVNPIFSVTDLSVMYQQSVGLLKGKKTIVAVNNLSFNLYPSKTLALVGESGSGKSTVAKALLLLGPIHSGTLCYKKVNIQDMGVKQLRQFRRKVQIVLQDPYSSLNPRMTIEEILKEGLSPPLFKKRKEIEANLVQLLDQVQLPKSTLDRYPHQFSGGQRQRICIARALATKPEIIICDEPTSALDMSVQAQILNLLRLLQSELKLSYLFITHNMGVVSYLADEVLVMKEGSCVEMGTIEQILNHCQHPYTQNLLKSTQQV